MEPNRLEKEMKNQFCCKAERIPIHKFKKLQFFSTVLVFISRMHILIFSSQIPIWCGVHIFYESFPENIDGHSTFRSR